MGALTQEEKAKLVLDPRLYIALLEAEEGREPFCNYSFRTIGDRVRLLNELEKQGFKIVKIEE